MKYILLAMTSLLLCSSNVYAEIVAVDEKCKISASFLERRLLAEFVPIFAKVDIAIAEVKVKPAGQIYGNIEGYRINMTTSQGTKITVSNVGELAAMRQFVGLDVDNEGNALRKYCIGLPEHLYGRWRFKNKKTTVELDAYFADLFYFLVP